MRLVAANVVLPSPPRCGELTALPLIRSRKKDWKKKGGKRKGIKGTRNPLK